jgi:hypothetical protein
MHKNTTKCNKTQSKWCINKHGASKIIDTFETYHRSRRLESKKGDAGWAFLLGNAEKKTELEATRVEAAKMEALVTNVKRRMKRQHLLKRY